MAVAHGKSAALLLDGYSLTGFARSFAIDPSIDVHDSTVFGLSSRTKVTGLKHATATGEVFYDDTATTGSYDVLKTQYGSATPATVTFAPQGLALGSRILQLYAHEVNFTPSQVVDDLIKMSLSLEASEDAADFGISLHALSAETSLPVTGTGVDNSAATDNGGVGVVHVTAIAGASPNVVYKIQHATDGSTWVDLITFSAITAANSVRRTEVAAGTNIRRHLRMTATEGGTTTSITGAVAFARR